MDIDLLLTPQHQTGLLSSKNLVKKVAGVLFDAENSILSLEYVDMDHLDLNIPVESEFHGALDASAQIHIGSVKDGKIAQAYQVPLMFLDDPYRAEAFANLEPPAQPLQAFYYFVKNCILGQPVHRDDAGNEESAGCILGDATPASLEFAQHLARRHGMELGEHANNTMNAPGLGLGTSSGGGSSAAGGGGRSTYQRQRSNYFKNRSDKDKKE